MENITLPAEDISTLIKNKPRLIFVIGSLSAGKTSHCQKLVNEFKIPCITIHSLIEKEIAANSNEGKLLNDFKTKQENIPSILICKILLQEIINLKKKTIVIDGFPKTLEDAIFFEENIMPITLIVNFLAKEETCLRQFEEDCKIKGKEFNVDKFKEKYAARQAKIQEIVNFYGKYGIVKDINGDKRVGAIATEFKQSLYPTIYAIIGKRYSGKTELSKILNQRQGITLIDFNVFKQKPIFKKHKNDENFLVTSFITMLRTIEDQRVLIENFPENKSQYSHFVNNCKPFERIYYLNASNSSCLERRNALPITDVNYIDCCQLNQLLYDFEQQNDFIKFLKRQTIPLKPKDENGFFIEIKEAPPKPKPKPAEGEEAPKVKKEEPIDLTNKKLIIMEVDVNNHKKLTINNIINQIQPFIVIIKCKEELKENKANLIANLEKGYQFEVIDLNQIIENGKKRKILGEEELTIEQKIKIIQPLLFRENCNRFILENFPNDILEVVAFEKSLCPINKLITISDDKILENIQDENSIEIYFKNEKKLSIIPSGEVKPFQIEECLNMTKDINIVYGMPLSGKTSIAQHLKNKHNFTLLDFQDLVKIVKKSKADPENPDADPEAVEITFDDLIEGLKNYLEKETKNNRIIIDNFFIAGGAEPFIIDNADKAKTVINTIGKFRNLYEIQCEDKTLIDRYKTKEGIAEELNEEQKAAFDETLKVPKELLELIKSLSANVVGINGNEPLEKAKKTFDYSNTRNFIIVKHEYDINIERNLELFSARNKILYINVPKLIYSHFANHDAMSLKLEDSYGKKQLKNEITDPTNIEGYIYYKYNPIHFEPSLINEMILAYVSERYKEIENSGNYVILTGYLNYDLLDEADLPFNLPLLEVKHLLELGELTSFIEITKTDIKQEEDEQAVELVKEKKVKQKKVDPLDVDGNPEGENPEGNPQEEQPPEEENPEDAGKFKPEGLCWTNYDGVPRNYVQVLKRLKVFPVNLVESTPEAVGEQLTNTLKEHLEKFEQRAENKYNGAINIIKV